MLDLETKVKNISVGCILGLFGMKNQKPISECFNPKACKLQKFEFEFEFEKVAQILTLKKPPKYVR